MTKFLSENGLLYYDQKNKQRLNEKVDKVEGKGLSTNDLTDELKQKILNAGDSSFSGNYNDLSNKPDLTDMATKTYVTQQLANINKKQIVTSLSDMADPNTIYLMTNSGSGNNSYDEYLVINNNPEKIGSTDVDLTNYLQKNELTALTNAEIDLILEN